MSVLGGCNLKQLQQPQFQTTDCVHSTFGWKKLQICVSPKQIIKSHFRLDVVPVCVSSDAVRSDHGQEH